MIHIVILASVFFIAGIISTGSFIMGVFASIIGIFVVGVIEAFAVHVLFSELAQAGILIVRYTLAFICALIFAST